MDFGDGTPAATTTAHVYAAPGTYTIRVTQADTIGNIGTATHVVTVTAPVPGPPVHAPPPAAAARTPSIGLATARFAVAWRASVARGHLVLQGTSTRTAIVTGALIRPGFRKPLRFGVATGAWTARIPVPRRMLPGRYQLVLDGEPAAEVAAVIGRGIRLAAPPEGIVADHRVSSSRGGPDAISFTRPRALHVVLRFAALPRFGLPLRLDIHGPNGYRDRRDHRRRATVGAVVTNEGARLARGRWQFTLRAGPTVVKRVAVLVR